MWLCAFDAPTCHFLAVYQKRGCAAFADAASVVGNVHANGGLARADCMRSRHFVLIEGFWPGRRGLLHRVRSAKWGVAESLSLEVFNHPDVVCIGILQESQVVAVGRRNGIRVIAAEGAAQGGRVPLRINKQKSVRCR